MSLRKYSKLASFMLRMLPGYRWKLPFTLLLGFGDIAILILIPLTGAYIINALGAHDWDDFRDSLLKLALLTVSRTVVNFTHLYVFSRIDERAGNSLRATVFNSVLRKELRFFERHSLGDIISRGVNDTTMFKSFLTAVLLQLVYDSLTVVVVVLILIRMNPTLGALTILIAPITLIFGRLAQPRIEAASLRVRENVAGLTGYLQSWLSRPFSFKAHLLVDQASKRFATKNDEFTGNSIRLSLIGTILGALNST
ncbi:MAG: ABC transporter transmembrane domain-containing protein, partial [Pyrinomonadaceae bacterium]